MAEAFFHRKTAVFNYFQLAIEILAWTRSRKPLCLQVWNFDPIDSFSQIWSHCSYPKWLDAKLKSSPIFSKVTQIHQAFGILLIETMSPRTFKNRPIWSHCRGVAFFSSCPGFDSCPYHKKILLLGSYFGTNVKNKIVENRRIRETPFQIFDYDHSVLLSRPS